MFYIVMTSCHMKSGIKACGKYCTVYLSPSNTTLTISKTQSVSYIPFLSSHFPAAASSFLRLAGPTFSSGAASIGRTRLLTSTKCIPSAAMEMMSISKCPHLQFLARTVCPAAIRYAAATSSPLRPTIPRLPPSPVIIQSFSDLTANVLSCLSGPLRSNTCPPVSTASRP